MGRKRPPRVSGVALVDKPSGVTSHDVVQILRRGLGQSQVGHTGTLDPAATGLMVVTLGRATRIARFLEAEEKVYEGTVRLGRSTTTWDAEGETTEVAAVDEAPERARVEAVLAGLEGPLEHVTPAFSAIKVNGERLHAKARRGEVVEGPRRAVLIHRLELMAVQGADLSIRAQVSKGTYIRSLAVEIGRQLGYPAHLARLRRTRVGPHRLEQAWPPERFCAPEPPVISASEALAGMPAVALEPKDVEDVAQGRPLPRELDVERARLMTPEGTLAAVARTSERDPRRWAYDVVLVRPGEEPQGTV